jgi:hypothetical protein
VSIVSIVLARGVVVGLDKGDARARTLQVAATFGCRSSVGDASDRPGKRRQLMVNPPASTVTSVRPMRPPAASA